VADITSNLVVDYRFLETSGTSVLDYSGGNRTATWTGDTNVIPVTGPYTSLPGFAFSSTKYLTMPALAAQLGNNCSLTWWQKRTTATPVGGTETTTAGFGNFGAVLPGHGAHIPWSDSVAYLNFARASNNTTSSRYTAGSMPGGTTRTNWNFYAITQAVGANGFKFYENNVLVSQGTGITPYWDDDLWNLGRSTDGTNNWYFAGSMANPRIYARTLSTDDLTLLMAFDGNDSIPQVIFF
jgi:hypothetical protein